jgi:hypothetical protein
MVWNSQVEGFPRVMFSLADSCMSFVGFSFLVALVVMYELCFCLFRNEIGGVPLVKKNTTNTTIQVHSQLCWRFTTRTVVLVYWSTYIYMDWHAAEKKKRGRRQERRHIPSERRLKT